MKLVLSWLLLLLGSMHLQAQEEVEANKAPRKFKGRHSIGIVIGHAHILNGNPEEGQKTIILPLWGLDYNFQFSRKFAVGLHTDIIVESFEVEEGHRGGAVVERTRPIAPAAMFFFKPTKRWSFGAGMGGEFAKEADYSLTRVAVEYGSEVGKGWAVFGVLQYDFRWSAYDTWSIGLGISKTLGWKKLGEE